MITWFIVSLLSLGYLACALNNESPFNIAIQIGLAGYILYIGGAGMLIPCLLLILSTAAYRH